MGLRCQICTRTRQHCPQSLCSQEKQLWWFPPYQQGTNVNQAKLADIFWRSLDWWANQSLSPCALIPPMQWEWLQQQQGRKDGHLSQWFLWRMGNLLTKKWHPCQFQTKSSILNALKLIWRLEKVKYIFNETMLNKKAGKNPHNQELVGCTLYKSHSAVISAPQFKVKATKTLYWDVTWILAASKYWSFNIIGWFATS